MTGGIIGMMMVGERYFRKIAYNYMYHPLYIYYSLTAFQLVKIINECRVLNNNSLLFHQKKYIFNEVINYLGETMSSN